MKNLTKGCDENVFRMFLDSNFTDIARKLVPTLFTQTDMFTAGLLHRW